MKKLFIALLVVLMSFSMVACGGEKEEEKTVLNVQFVPTNNDGSMEAKAKPFAEYLTEKLGMEVKVTLATDFSTIVEAMASGKVDLGIMPPAAYVQARNLGAAEALLTSALGDYDQVTGLAIPDSKTGTFKGEVLVRADSGIKEFADLKGKKIATLNPSSASCYIYPIAELKELGIDPTVDCTLVTVNDIPSEMTAVLEGQVDACFVFEGARNVFGGKFDENIMETLKVLYLTKGDIPNDAIAVQPSMDADLKAKIVDVFMNMINDEAGAEAMSMWNHKGYDAADEKAYDTIEAYTEAAAE